MSEITINEGIMSCCGRASGECDCRADRLPVDPDQLCENSATGERRLAGDIPDGELAESGLVLNVPLSHDDEPLPLPPPLIANAALDPDPDGPLGLPEPAVVANVATVDTDPSGPLLLPVLNFQLEQERQPAGYPML